MKNQKNPVLWYRFEYEFFHFNLRCIDRFYHFNLRCEYCTNNFVWSYNLDDHRKEYNPLDNINNLKMSNPAGENAAPEDEDNEKGI